MSRISTHPSRLYIARTSLVISPENGSASNGLGFSTVKLEAGVSRETI
jgi:hypothetical protein